MSSYSKMNKYERLQQCYDNVQYSNFKLILVDDSDMKSIYVSKTLLSS